MADLGGRGAESSHSPKLPAWALRGAGWLGERGAALAVGAAILIASLAHLGATSDALNNFDPPKRLVWAVLALVLSVGWLSRSRDRSPAIVAIAVALGAWMTARTLLRPHLDVELEVLWAWLMPLVLFVLGLQMSGRGRRVLGACVLLAGALQLACMLLQRYGHDPFFPETTRVMTYLPGRMIGTIGYQNQAVDFVAVCGAALFILVRQHGIRFLALALLLGGVMLTGNRSGIAGLLAAMASAQTGAICQSAGSCAARRWRALVLTWGAMAALASLVLLVPGTGARVRSLWAGTRGDPAVGSRRLMATVAWQLWRERPWTGWGAGEYAFQYLPRLARLLPENKSHELLRQVVYAREAHNDIMQFGAEFGSIGLLLAAALAAAILYRAWNLRVVHPGQTWATVYLVSFLEVVSLASFPWQTSMSGPLAGLLLGWLLVEPAGDEDALPSQSRCSAVRSGVAKGMIAVWSLLAFGWYACDAVLNVTVGEDMATQQPDRTARVLPSWMYRYHALVGANYTRQNDLPKAEEHLVHAWRGYRDPLLYNNLGAVLSQQGKWAQACAVYAEWAATGLDHARALGNLSVAYEQLGQSDRAAAILERKRRLYPTDDPAELMRLAVLHLRAGHPAEADRIIRQHEANVVRRGQTLPAEWENLAGVALWACGEPEAARRRFQAALTKNPRLESARRNLERLEKTGVREQPALR